MDPAAYRYYRSGMSFDQYFSNRYGHSPNDYSLILMDTGLSAKSCKQYFDYEVQTFMRLKSACHQLTIYDLMKEEKINERTDI